MPQALGLIETKGLVAAIEAADAMVKAANVKFVGKDVTKPAMITIKVVGDTAAVKSAIDAGAAAAGRVGQLISTHIIPQPDGQLINMLPEISEKNEPVKSSSKEKPFATKKDLGEKEKRTKKESVQKSEDKIEEDELLKEEPEKIVEIVEEDEEEVTESKGSPSDTISRLRNEALGIQEKDKKKNADEKMEKSGPDEIEEDIESLNVHKLRHLARSIPDFPIKGREISRANRDELLKHFRKLK